MLIRPDRARKDKHMTTAHDHYAAQLPPPTMEEVSPGIYAYVQLDGSWGLNNAVTETAPSESRPVVWLRAEARSSIVTWQPKHVGRQEV